MNALRTFGVSRGPDGVGPPRTKGVISRGEPLGERREHVGDAGHVVGEPRQLEVLLHFDMVVVDLVIGLARLGLAAALARERSGRRRGPVLTRLLPELGCLAFAPIRAHRRGSRRASQPASGRPSASRCSSSHSPGTNACPRQSATRASSNQLMDRGFQCPTMMAWNLPPIDLTVESTNW